MPYSRYRNTTILTIVAIGLAATFSAKGQDASKQFAEKFDIGPYAQANRMLVVDYPKEGVRLGQGWNSFLNSKAPGFCVEGVEYQPKTERTLSMRFSRIEDVENYFASLSISASASFNAGAFGGDAKTDFAKSTKIDTQDLNILATLRINEGASALVPLGSENGSVKAGALQLSKETSDLLNSGEAGQIQWRYRCGDRFVVGIRSGGELNVVLHTGMNAQENKESLFASFSASGFGGAAKGGASISSFISDRKQKSTLKYDFFRSGASKSSNPTSIEEVIARIQIFGTPDDDFKPIPFEVYTLPYTALDNYPRNVTSSSPSSEYPEMLAAHYARLQQLARQYSEVIANPNQYRIGAAFGDDTHGLYETQSIVLNAAKTAERQLTECFSKLDCDPPSSTTKLSETLGGLPSGTAIAKFDQRQGEAQIQMVTGAPDAGLRALVGSGIFIRPHRDRLSVHDLKTTLRLMGETDKQPSDNQSKPVPNPQNDGIALPNAATAYYAWLARKPLANTELDPRTLILKADKKSYLDDITKKTDDGKISEATTRMRSWLLANRLLPVSETFCERDAQHHMCVSATTLWNILGSIKFALSIDQLKPDPTPPPPPPAPPKPEFFWGCGTPPHGYPC